MGSSGDQEIRELGDRIGELGPDRQAELGALVDRIGRLADDAPIAVAILLRECESAVRQVVGGRAPDPAATLAAAVRFARAAVAGPSPASERPPRSRPAPAVPVQATGAARERARVSFEFDEGDRELVAEFVHEATDYIEQAEAAMLVLEGTPDDTTAVDTVFRAFHTVKGVSAMLGLEPIAKLAHKAESLLSRVRSREIHFQGSTANLALAAVDAIKALIEGVQSALAGERWHCPLDLEELGAALVAATSGAPPDVGPSSPLQPLPEARAASALPPVPVDAATASAPSELPPPVKPPPAAPSAAREPPPVREPTPASREAAPAAQPSPIAAAAAAPRDAAPAASVAAQTESSVRVRTERLDRLVDMVGELVIAHSMVRQDPTVVGGEHHDLSRKVAHAGKIVRELQELAMSLRMVPLKPTFQKMVRVVRDTAQKSGKEVELILSGEDTEIDRNMVDVVADPLVHMLRNAVDHGVEGPAERVAKGKPRQGTVRLTASHSGGSVVVELADNGAGLDRSRIVRKAIERGLIESDAGMSDSDVFNLIFEPGFSTRDQVTDVSGRGVGMDVVRRNVQALNGRIEISSVLGQGTTFTLRLPLTLAVTDGMLVRVGGERYIVPTVNIQTSLRPTAENISTVSGRGELLVIRGELIPMFRLHRLFGVPASVQDPTKALAVIVNGVEGRCALLVDELLGQQQVVAKSLGGGLGTVRGIAGGAILGDGRVGLILDTPEIIALARDESGARLTEHMSN